jgi:hypothetical protein
LICHGSEPLNGGPHHFYNVIPDISLPNPIESDKISAVSPLEIGIDTDNGGMENRSGQTVFIHHTLLRNVAIKDLQRYFPAADTYCTIQLRFRTAANEFLNLVQPASLTPQELWIYFPNLHRGVLN